MKKLFALLWVLPFLALFVIGTAVALIVQREAAESLSFTVRAGRATRRLSCWNQNDTCYVFLPSYADPSEVQVTVHGKAEVEGQNIASFLKGGFETGRTYALTASAEDLPSKIRFEKSANAATIYIDTASGSMEQVDGSERHDYKEDAVITVYTADGVLNYQSHGRDSIKGHGNWSWEQDKKSYKLTLAKSWDLLGTGTGNEYVLAANVMDPSSLRNRMIYAFADEIGTYPDFAPETCYADVYFNGTYAGLYLLCDKIESSRYQLPLDPGSSLLEMNLDSHVSSSRPSYDLGEGMAVEIKYPEVPSEERAEEIVDSFRSLIRACEEGTGWKEQIDLDSWVNRYLIDEVFLNYDAGTGSQYFFYDASAGRWFAGPCWDFDNTLGIGAQNNWNTILTSREWYSQFVRTPLFYSLMNQPEFAAKVKETYQKVFLPKLEELVNSKITELDREITAARQMNAVRWTEGYDASDTEAMRSFLQDRIRFLNSLWIEGTDYCVVTLKGPAYRYYYIEKGTECGQLPIPEQMGVTGSYNWVVENTGEIFHYDAVITEDMSLIPEYK